MSEWVVIVPKGSAAKCYGLFDSYDLALAWVRRNELKVKDVQCHPLNHDEHEPELKQQEPANGESIAVQLREAVTVLDEPFHRETVAQLLLRAADALEETRP